MANILEILSEFDTKPANKRAWPPTIADSGV